MKILNEKYDSIQSVFNDPEFKNSNVYTSLVGFKKSGGEILGEGTFGIVLTRPEWKFVLKIFVRDDAYLRFVRFAIKNPRKSYPKFYDVPRRIKTNISSTPDDKGKTRDIEALYVVRVEKLLPITSLEFSDIQYYLVNKSSNSWSSYPPKTMNELRRIERMYPGIEELNDDFIYVIRGITNKKNMDWKRENIMKRESGEFVLSDPFYDYDTSSMFQEDLR